MKTDDPNYTPTVDNIGIEFSSTCFSSGQVFFSGLANDTYSITVSKSGYQDFTDSNILVSPGWQSYKVQLLTQ
jgi:hypothetical protein